MALTYGFYNSVSGDRKYDADQMSSVFDGVINDGVFPTVGEMFAVKATSGLTITVAPGRAWFNRTWTYLDVAMPLTIGTAHPTLARIDAVVLEVNKRDDTRANNILVLAGTADASPQKPTLSNSGDVYQHALAYITVPAGATAIAQGNIEYVVGQSECPFVTSVIETTNIDSLFAQWDDQFNTWFSNVQAQLEGDIAANLQRQIDALYTNEEVDAIAQSSRIDNKVIRFITESQEITIPENISDRDAVVFGIGGGGGGGGNRGVSDGGSATSGGGGGGGEIFLETVKLEPGSTHTVVIGAGGSAGTNDTAAIGGSAGKKGGDGGVTSFDDFTANGGIGGSPSVDYLGGNGGSGGSGGGGGYTYMDSATGNTRSNGGSATSGGGGGAGNHGTITESTVRPGNGGTYGGGGGSSVSSTAIGTGGQYGGNGGNYTTKSLDGPEYNGAMYLFAPENISIKSGTIGKGGNTRGGGGGYGGDGGFLSNYISGGGGGGFFGKGGKNGQYGGGGGGGFLADGGNGGYGGGGGGGAFEANSPYPVENGNNGGGYGGGGGATQAGRPGVVVLVYYIKGDATI